MADVISVNTSAEVVETGKDLLVSFAVPTLEVSAAVLVVGLLDFAEVLPVVELATVGCSFLICATKRDILLALAI